MNALLPLSILSLVLWIGALTMSLTNRQVALRRLAQGYQAEQQIWRGALRALLQEAPETTETCISVSLVSPPLQATYQASILQPDRHHLLFDTARLFDTAIPCEHEEHPPGWLSASSVRSMRTCNARQVDKSISFLGNAIVETLQSSDRSGEDPLLMAALGYLDVTTIQSPTNTILIAAGDIRVHSLDAPMTTLVSTSGRITVMGGSASRVTILARGGFELPPGMFRTDTGALPPIRNSILKSILLTSSASPCLPKEQ